MHLLKFGYRDCRIIAKLLDHCTNFDLRRRHRLQVLGTVFNRRNLCLDRQQRHDNCRQQHSRNHLDSRSSGIGNHFSYRNWLQWMCLHFFNGRHD